MIISVAPEPAPTTPERLLALPLSSSVAEPEQHEGLDTGESSDFESNPDDDDGGDISHTIDTSLLSHKLEKALSTIDEQVEENTPHEARADTTSKLDEVTDLIQVNSEEATELEPYSENGNTNTSGEATLDHSESSLLDDDNPTTAFGGSLLEPSQPSHFHDEDTLEQKDSDVNAEDNRIYDDADLLYSGPGARRGSLELKLDFADRDIEHDDGSDDSTETAKAGDSANDEPMIDSGNAEHDDQETVLEDLTHKRDTEELYGHMRAAIKPDPLASAYCPSDDNQEDESKLENPRVDSAFATGPLTPESPSNTSEGAPSSTQHTFNHDDGNINHKQSDWPDSLPLKSSNLPQSYEATVLPTTYISPEGRPAIMSWILTTPPRSGPESNEMKDAAPDVSPTAQIGSGNTLGDDGVTQEAERSGEMSDIHTNPRASAAAAEDGSRTTSKAVCGSSTSVLDIMKSYHFTQNNSGLPFVRFEPIHSSDDLVQLEKDSASGQALPFTNEHVVDESASAFPGPAAWWERTLTAAWTPSIDVLHAWTDSKRQPAMTAPKANLRSPTAASMRRAARNTRNQRKHGRPARMLEVSPEQMVISSKWNNFSSDVEAHDAEMFTTSQRAIEARRAEFALNEGEHKPVFKETFKKTIAGDRLGDRRVVAVTNSIHAVLGASDIGKDDAEALSSYKHAPILLPPVRAPVLPEQEYDPWPVGLEEQVLRRVASLSPARSARVTTPDRPIVFDPHGKSSDKENRAPVLAGSSSSPMSAMSSGPSSPVSLSPSSFRGRRFATPIALKLSQAILRSESGTPPVTGASDDTVPMDSPSLSAGILPPTEIDEQTPLMNADESSGPINDTEQPESAKSTSSTVTKLLTTILGFLTRSVVALFGFWTTLGEKMDNAFLHLKGLFSGDLVASDEERVYAITATFARFTVVDDEGAVGGRESSDDEGHEQTDTLWIRKPRVKSPRQQNGGATARDVEESAMEGDVLEEQEEEEPGEEWWI